MKYATAFPLLFVALLVSACTTGPFSMAVHYTDGRGSSQPVMFIQGGTIDDSVSYLFLTTLSDLLREHPQLDQGIARLIWIGGAINVDGNLDPNTIPAEVANPKAEWNAFWDPQSVDWIFQNTTFPIILFPLDGTEQVPITRELARPLWASSWPSASTTS